MTTSRLTKKVESRHKVLGNIVMPHNKALQRTRLSDGCFPWRSVRTAELGR